MEIQLKAALISYFSQLASTDLRWNEFLDKIKRPVEALKNQSEQYCHVTSKEVDNAEISNIDGLREKLVFAISAGIEREVSTILDEFRRVKSVVEDLERKLIRVEKARTDATVSEPIFQELVNGTPYVPRLDLLLEWSIESCTYYRKLVIDLFETFKSLDYRSYKNVTEWEKSLEQSRDERARIKYILGFTQFIAKESVK